jgi:hypothetical protein
MDSRRRIETALATFSLVALAVFAVLETYASWVMLGGARALVHPGYIQSVVGMILLYAGARHSLRLRPRCAPGLLCASHAWWAGIGWRATQARIYHMAEGGTLTFGSPELWATTAATAVTFVAFAISFYLTYRSSAAAHASATAHV